MTTAVKDLYVSVIPISVKSFIFYLIYLSAIFPCLIDPLLSTSYIFIECNVTFEIAYLSAIWGSSPLHNLVGHAIAFI